jgi:predicted phage-related endonuclease
MGTIRIESRAQWIELRSSYVGSSEVACLFGLGRCTEFELYHRKLGSIAEADLSHDVRVVCGTEIEAGAAKVFSVLHKLQIRKVKRYLFSDHVRGMGGSLDYEMLDGAAGWVPLEIKCVDWLVWRDEWDQGESTARHDRIITDIQPPLAIDLQIQHQLALAKKPHGYCGLLVAGNQPYLIRRDRFQPIIDEIETRIARFWQRVEMREEPPIEAASDLEVVTQLYRDVDKEHVADLSADNELPELCANFLRVSRTRLDAEKEEKRLKAEILARMGEAGKFVTASHFGSCPTIHKAGRFEPAREIPASCYRGALNIKDAKQ